VEHLGLTDQGIIETPISAPDCTTVNADVVYFDRASGNRSVGGIYCAYGSDTTLAVRGELDAVRARLRERELAKRSHNAVKQILNSEGNNTVFYPSFDDFWRNGWRDGGIPQVGRTKRRNQKAIGTWQPSSQESLST